MPRRSVVSGQRVTPEKAALAKELRRQMTPHERILWEQLRAHRLSGLHFRRQQVIDGFVVDFYCHRCALVVEVDGGVHEQQRSYDAERDRVLAERGLRVLRVPNEEVQRDLTGVLARIAVPPPQVKWSGNSQRAQPIGRRHRPPAARLTPLTPCAAYAATRAAARPARPRSRQGSRHP